MGFISKTAIPIIAIFGFVLAIYSLCLEDQRKIRLDQIIQLSTEINNRGFDNNSNLDSLRNEIIQLQFEKQSYTANLEMMSNWFILFETILFGIFFVVGYGIFDNKITEAQKESHTAYKNTNERYLQHKKEFDELKLMSLKDSYRVNAMIAESYRIDGVGFLWMNNCIESARKARLIYDLDRSDDSLATLTNCIGNIKSGLNTFYSQNKLGVIPGKETFEEAQRDIIEITNLDANHLKEVGNIINRQLSEIIKKNEIWLSDDKNEMPTDTKM